VSKNGINLFVETDSITADSLFLRYDYEDGYYYEAPAADRLNCSACVSCVILGSSTDFVKVV